jgi:Dolichyl-phosphate-mannose-protein mannosyltransferase
MQNLKIDKTHIKIILSISLLNLFVYLVTTAFFSYGIFRDELYYIACANRPAFGYVDHPPLSIWILGAWKFLFGDSMFVIRIVPAIISSITIFMIGLFTIRLGGGKTAAIISTLAFMFSPIFLGISTIYSMNIFDFFFWITSAYIFLRIIQTENKNLWILLGLVIGFGLMNKTSMLWLCAGIFIGIIFTPLRKELKTKYPYIAAVIALIIFAPFIIWNITHDFAHLEFMRNAASRKYGGLTPVSFILDQILILNPLSILIWLPGIIFYFFNKESKQYRTIGFIWLTTFIILVINWHSKGEYVAASYQLLFAGGAVLIEKWSSKKAWLKYSLVIPALLFGIFLSPFARPLLSPETFLKYQGFVRIKPPANEGVETTMPQFYCDMFNWEKMAKKISEIYLTIPEEERNTTAVYCYNYGKAGAMEYFSKKYPLPEVVCPHNSYWYWWPAGKHISTIIVMGGEKENYLDVFEQVEQAGFYKAEYAMPYENNLKIFIGRGLKMSIERIRQEDKFFM